VEGLQAVLIIQRKLAYQFPLWFVKPVLGPVAWRFLRDLGGMKSPILGPCFESSQQDDCTGVCRPFCGGQVHDSGLHPGRRESGEVSAVESGEVSAVESGGLHQ
ncbi:unnamed protein product, partial [Staurois parvus]